MVGDDGLDAQGLAQRRREHQPLGGQLDHAGVISSDRAILVEVFEDAIGDPRSSLRLVQTALLGLRQRPPLTPGAADTVVRTVGALARLRVGALIVIPGRESIERQTGREVEVDTAEPAEEDCEPAGVC